MVSAKKHVPIVKKRMLSLPLSQTFIKRPGTPSLFSFAATLMRDGLPGAMVQMENACEEEGHKHGMEGI